MVRKNGSSSERNYSEEPSNKIAVDKISSLKCIDKNDNFRNSPADKPDKSRAIKNISTRSNDLEFKKRIPDSKLHVYISLKVLFLQQKKKNH